MNPNYNINKNGLLFKIPKNKKLNKTILNKNNYEYIDESVKLDVPYNFINVVNSIELFKLTNSFKDDVYKGIKNFGFYGIHSNKIFETILALSSSLSYNCNNISVLIVASNVHNFFEKNYSHLISKGTLGWLNTYDWGPLTFVDFDDLSVAKNKSKNDFIYLIMDFEVSFWEISLLSKNVNIDLEIIKIIETVSFVFDVKKTKFKEIENLEKYFLDLGKKTKSILKDGEY